MGPLGRAAEAQLVVGDGGRRASCYSYSLAAGAFLGVALEGSVVKVGWGRGPAHQGLRRRWAHRLPLRRLLPAPPAARAPCAAARRRLHAPSPLWQVRDAVNHSFYGFPVSARQLLLGDEVPPPPAAATLYAALHGLLHKFENRGGVATAAARRQAAGSRCAAAGNGGSSSSSAAAAAGSAAAAAGSSAAAGGAGASAAAAAGSSRAGGSKSSARRQKGRQ